MMRGMPWKEYKAYLDFIIRCPWIMNPYFSHKKEEDEDKEPDTPQFFKTPADFAKAEPLSDEQMANLPFVKDIAG